MLLTNLPGTGIYHPEMWFDNSKPDYMDVLQNGGLLDILYIGVKTSVYPCLIFLGVGAMTDFGPLLANPKSMLLGAAAQLGIYCAFLIAVCFFTGNESAAIAIIGGADGPTAIYVTNQLAPHLLGPIAVAAYSYMALIPLIQPPLMKMLTTKKEKLIRMEPPKNVSKAAKIIFPIMVTIITALLLPSVAPLLGCLMLGNLFKECGVTERLSDTAQNALMNIVTLLLGISVGATATAENFCLSTRCSSSVWDCSLSASPPSAAFCSESSCAGLPKAKSILLSVRRAYPPCLWRRECPIRWEENTTPTIICSCTQWVPTWRAS